MASAQTLVTSKFGKVVTAPIVKRDLTVINAFATPLVATQQTALHHSISCEQTTIPYGKKVTAT